MPKDTLTRVVGTRVTHKEHRKLQALADAQHVTIAHLLYQAVKAFLTENTR